jgi:NADPH:quinone reductase-like Zn-dependent oxidoreductase
MKALVLTEKGHPTKNFKIESQFPKPSPASHEVLVKVHSSALNPVDYKMAHYGFLIKSFPIILGCDMSGTVAEVGKDVTNVKVGDEVFATTRLGTPGCGSFAEYALVPAKQLGKKPKNLTFDQACTIGVSLCTAAMAVFQKFNFPLSSLKNPHTDKPPVVLVWGASGSVGMFAVQLAALSGATVIGVASEKNAEYVKSMGAKHVIDYSKHDVAAEVHRLVGDEVTFAMDCVGKDTAQKATAALSKTKPAVIACVAGGPTTKPDNVSAHDVAFGMSFDSNAEFFEHLYEAVQPLLEAGKLHPVRHENIGGMEKITEGLQRLADNKVSGEKLVATICH